MKFTHHLLPCLPVLLIVSALGSVSSVAAQHAGHTAHTAAPAPMKNNSVKTSAAPLPLVVQNSSMVAVPPTIKETSAFITLKNNGKQTIKLVGVKAAIAGQSMFMKTIKQQNMMGMLPVTEFIVPAGGTLSMNNDGNHIMIMNLKRPLKVGEVLPIVLQASDGRSITVKVTVKKP